MLKHIWRATLGACILATTAHPQAPVIPGIRVLPDLEYAKVGAKSMTLDLYLPESAAAKVPVIVWIHGGGWMAGDRKNPPGMNLVRRGYALASVEYRLSQEAVFPAQIYDCKAAIRWLRANADKYGLDPAHFAAWGHSAGGHLVALLGTTGDVTELEGHEGNPGISTRLQAVCDWAGPIDFVADPAQAGPDSGPSRLIGGAVRDNPDKAKRANPITYIGKDAPPFFIVHGECDRLVPVAQAEMLAEALTKAGAPVTLVVRPWTGHGINDPTVNWMQDQFLDHCLKGAK